MPTLTRIRYRDAGVNIDEADRALSSIKKLARQTFTRGVLTDIGSFGAAGWLVVSLSAQTIHFKPIRDPRRLNFRTTGLPIQPWGRARLLRLT